MKLLAHDEYWELVFYCQVRNLSSEPIVINWGPDLSWRWLWRDDKGCFAACTVPGDSPYSGCRVIFPNLPARQRQHRKDNKIQLAVDLNEMDEILEPHCFEFTHSIHLYTRRPLTEWRRGDFTVNAIFRVMGKHEFESVGYDATFSGEELFDRILAHDLDALPSTNTLDLSAGSDLTSQP